MRGETGQKEQLCTYVANPNQEGRDQVVIAHHWYPPVGGELLGEGDLLAEGSALQGFDSPAP